jgi:UTP-glucose-1-phosphate uridylyltransferase
MMKPTLLIMAAGIGSRYGGLKQIDPVGPHDETILEYSVHDAMRAGFGRLVFVVRSHFADIFREKVGSKFENKLEVSYVNQELDRCVGELPIPAGREKPWGTAHAVLVAKELVNGPFAVINADDYYGANSFQIMADYFSSNAPSNDNDYAMVGYILRNTLSEHGHVARGVCTNNAQLFLNHIVERTKIEKDGDAARFIEKDGRAFPLTGDEIVSMNLWGFYPNIFQRLQTQFNDFLRTKAADLKVEFFISDEVGAMIRNGAARVKVLPTPDSWFGVTYREDKEVAVAGIRNLIQAGIYPEKLQESL